MYERFTEGARAVMQGANREAIRLQHGFIGTEHILLSILTDAHVVSILSYFDVEPDRVKGETMKIVLPGPDPIADEKLPMTPRAKTVLENAMQASRALHHNYVGTEHLLLGLMQEKEGVAAQILRQIGLVENSLMNRLQSGDFVAEHLAPVLYIQDGVILLRATGAATDKDAFMRIVMTELEKCHPTSVLITFTKKD
ncbi:hypothetical protein K8942_00635 [Candidatus Peribacteria bacterium]|nr:MAG: hypothetical protein K8942_00635 [Candidatus Peribacteria bacterium]